MHAFIGLSNLQQVTLATVAPGIAEALVATAIGLFAAIPAVIAYNRFARDIDRIAIQLETFIEEFSNILQRNVGHAADASACQCHSGHERRMKTKSPCLPSALVAAPRAAAPSTRSTWCPFIDVMLVLLIIFMVSAPLITTGLVDLPTVGKAQHQPDHVVEVVVGHRRERCKLRVDGKEGAPHHAAAGRLPK